MVFRRFKIRDQERGLLFKDREFQGLLGPGTYWYLDPLRKLRVDVKSVRDGWLESDSLDVIARSGALDGEAKVLRLTDRERALVCFDGRFEAVLGPGLYAIWTSFRDVGVEVIDASELKLDRPDLLTITGGAGGAEHLDRVDIEGGHVGMLFVNGRVTETLRPGAYAFWKRIARVRVERVDLRERVVDISGQEIMTADKVTLRLNAVVTFRVADAEKAVTTVESYEQALYREAQLALRAVIGTRELDDLLSDKDGVASGLLTAVREQARPFGVEVVALGVRDVILPGDMKNLLNQVTEARKAAEASLVTRREETAAMRSQANTARILENNPTLMRLRELEVLEKVADKANLNVLLGEQGLSDRVMKLL